MPTDSKRDLMSQAVCLDYDPDLWHDDATERRAIQLCMTGDGGRPCPALAVCLDIGTNPDNRTFTKDGVWGGVNSHKRDRIRAGRTREGDGDRNQTVTFTATNRRTRVQEFSS